MAVAIKLCSRDFVEFFTLLTVCKFVLIGRVVSFQVLKLSELYFSYVIRCLNGHSLAQCRFSESLVHISGCGLCDYLKGGIM